MLSPSSERVASSSSFISEGVGRGGDTSSPISGAVEDIRHVCQSGSMTPGVQKGIISHPIDLKVLASRLEMEAGETSEEEKGGKSTHLDRAQKEFTHISENNYIFTQDFQLKNLSVQRFGIYPEAVMGAIDYSIENDKLHIVEETLFAAALEVLEGKPSARTFRELDPFDTEEYANNVVIVDIFARPGGKIREYKTSGQPEVHSVVLWKKSENEVALIDPSNKKYSAHIKTALTAKYRDLTILSSPIAGNILYGPGDKDTGFSDENVAFPSPRDCIDIAVKIGFEINEQQKHGLVEEIESNAFKRLTNQYRINRKLTKFLDGTMIRELQSSKLDIRINATKFIIENTERIPFLQKLPRFEAHPLKTISLKRIKEAVAAREWA
jgi:hypothetical protein